MLRFSGLQPDKMVSICQDGGNTMTKTVGGFLLMIVEIITSSTRSLTHISKFELCANIARNLIVVFFRFVVRNDSRSILSFRSQIVK